MARVADFFTVRNVRELCSVCRLLGSPPVGAHAHTTAAFGFAVEHDAVQPGTPVKESNRYRQLEIGPFGFQWARSVPSRLGKEKGVARFKVVLLLVFLHETRKQARRAENLAQRGGHLVKWLPARHFRGRHAGKLKIGFCRQNVFGYIAILPPPRSTSTLSRGIQIL